MNTDFSKEIQLLKKSQNEMMLETKNYIIKSKRGKRLYTSKWGQNNDGKIYRDSRIKLVKTHEF